MRFYITTLALALFKASAAAQDPNPPVDCKGKNIQSAVAGEKYIYKNEAICDESWKLGINEDGIFGVWNGDALFKQYASGADTLRMGEKDNGETAYISVYHSGENAVIWELKCSDQPTTFNAKLAMKRDSANVVKFTKGPNTELWLVKTEGDDSISDDCILADDITPSPPAEQLPAGCEQATSCADCMTAGECGWFEDIQFCQDESSACGMEGCGASACPADLITCKECLGQSQHKQHVWSPDTNECLASCDDAPADDAACFPGASYGPEVCDCSEFASCTECVGIDKCAWSVDSCLDSCFDAPADVACFPGSNYGSDVCSKPIVDDDCGEYNVCTEANAAQFNPASDPDYFIQCGAGNTCYLMACAPGTTWDQSLLTCVSKGQNFFMSLLCGGPCD